MFTIQEGTRPGAIEITFTAKPDEATRNTLKANKFRWNGSKGVWYGFASAETMQDILSGAKTDTTTATATAQGIDFSKVAEYTGETFEGYMGGHGWNGSNSKYLYGADLSKAIREALKRCNVKGVSVSVKTYSGGQSIKLKIQENEGDLVSLEDYKKTFFYEDGTPNYSKAYTMAGYSCWLYYYGNDLTSYGERYTEDMLIDKFFALDDPTIKKGIFLSAIEYHYNALTRGDINKYYYSECEVFTEQLKTRIGAVQKIVNSFNYEDTNGQVDYFHVHFYADYELKKIA